jgi:hypothetical protein
MTSNPPVYRFDDPAVFAQRHIAGTKIDNDYQEKQLQEFHEEGHASQAWCIRMLSGDAKLSSASENKTDGAPVRASWLLLVYPKGKTESFLPTEGETCRIMYAERSVERKMDGKRVQVAEKCTDIWWTAQHIYNPYAAAVDIDADEWQRYAAFQVDTFMTKMWMDKFLKPSPGRSSASFEFGTPLNLRAAKSFFVKFQLKTSKHTMEAEIGSIKRFTDAYDPQDEDGPYDVSSKQQEAFQYLMSFRPSDIESRVNLFDHIPHMHPDHLKHNLTPDVVNQFEKFNEHQKAAYEKLLSNLPCGVGILPGGPGAGKTTWNLTVSCLAQARDIQNGGKKRGIKVLYLLDINKPLDDTICKIINLYDQLGLKKKAVRVIHWKLGPGRGPDFVGMFKRQAQLRRAPQARPNAMNKRGFETLDELVTDRFYEHRTTRYSALDQALHAGPNASENNSDVGLARQVHELYQETLDGVDFIATTPVPAADRFGDMWKPDLVFFDESPHARELSNLIAIAHYKPLAWIFSGDHRQTRPFLAAREKDNPLYYRQMQTSTMERAEKCNAIAHSLLINHRAYGGLQSLASKLFYNGTMVSSRSSQDRLPESTIALRKYMGQILGNASSSRLLVHLKDSDADKLGTSSYNLRHVDWVMARVSELLEEPKSWALGKTLVGKILIIAPYRQQVLRYKTAIENLARKKPDRAVKSHVEARTIDTVQGHEADVVFVDLVEEEPTPFIDDPNRLNVAITRARQAEFILMHSGLKTYSRSGNSTKFLKRIWDDCEREDQVARTSASERKVYKMASSDSLAPALDRLTLGGH